MSNRAVIENMLLLINESNWTNELPHDKTCEMACVPSKDSAQPGHPPSLIRVFTVHSMGS